MTPGTWTWYASLSAESGMRAEWIARRPGLNDKLCFSLREAEQATQGIIGATIEPRVCHLTSKGGTA